MNIQPKPRVFFRRGFWQCVSMRQGMECKAMGRTPEEAYLLWVEVYA